MGGSEDRSSKARAWQVCGLPRTPQWEAPSSAALPSGRERERRGEDRPRRKPPSKAGARRGKLSKPRNLETSKPPPRSPSPGMENASKAGCPAKVRLKPSKILSEGLSTEGHPRRPVPLEALPLEAEAPRSKPKQSEDRGEPSKPIASKPPPLAGSRETPEGRSPRTPSLGEAREGSKPLSLECWWKPSKRQLSQCPGFLGAFRLEAPEGHPSKPSSRSPTEVRGMPSKPSKGGPPKAGSPPMLPARFASQWRGGRMREGFSRKFPQHGRTGGGSGVLPPVASHGRMREEKK